MTDARLQYTISMIKKGYTVKPIGEIISLDQYLEIEDAVLDNYDIWEHYKIAKYLHDWSIRLSRDGLKKLDSMRSDTDLVKVEGMIEMRKIYWELYLKEIDYFGENKCVEYWINDEDYIDKL